MKTKLLLINTITLFAIMNCQEKKEVSLTNKNIEEKKMETSKIKDVLIKQIKEGASPEYWGETYGKEDLDALVQIEDTILKNNGYKTPEIEDFNQKIKKIFGRIIDNQSENSYLKIDRYYKCNEDLEYYPTYMGFNYIYVAKKYNFITQFEPLPVVLDYQKIYPEVSKYEENSYMIDTADGEIEVLMWKDVNNLLQKRNFNKQRLISRNKYLFTDDKSQFPWLVTHDKFFMRSLVTDFGYTEDKKLLKWALENTHLPLFYTYANDNDLEELGKLLWTKDCNGEIRVHQNTLDLLKEMSTPDENLYIMYVAEYLTNLEHLNANKELSDAQKAKIAAHLMYWGEQYKYDKHYDYNQMFMGHFWHYKDDGTYDKEFKKNNYYGLSKFKEWYEAAKKEENLFLDDESIPDSPQPLDYEFKARPIK
ncbi:hypothetical protein GFU95_02905 [Apibacter sp. B3889]|uniref:hypothetical protein n=1 Tax=unclassified Apibacter TaxID=2630820 RepID=UPI001326BD30|nr:MULTISPECIES: hypothetical protein [unclassified Apibacter]MXO33965.1 hypothetical protein [Apibacter sp. B3883]MXO41322.1 hypothetical protein [Apibacter sp. B3889]MXP04757.1 hypothetical protein [Apibacter sp. B3887]MXP06698.1 hypothetical protein [Apibacter sp. B3935]